jgi:hypothetical protein
MRSGWSKPGHETSKVVVRAAIDDVDIEGRARGAVHIPGDPADQDEFDLGRQEPLEKFREIRGGQGLLPSLPTRLPERRH